MGGVGQDLIALRFSLEIFRTGLERELAAAHRSGHPVGIIMFDIDRFKELNDRSGHGAGDKLLAAMPEKQRTYTLKKLRSMSVEVLLNARVVDAGPERVILHDGAVIPAHTLFWSAGVKAAPIAAALDTPHTSGGRIPVEPDLTLPGHPEVFVIGDMAYLEQDGSALPMTAPVAMQMGIYAGKAILAKESGTILPPFLYHDKGSMATIGRNAAVASAFGLNFRGYLAWLVWLLLHLYYLIGFRNRIVVMLNWVWYYWFHERQVRLITRRVPEREREPNRSASNQEEEGGYARRVHPSPRRSDARSASPANRASTFAILYGGNWV